MLGMEQAILSPNDPELRKDLKPLTTSTKLSGSSPLGMERFKGYSSWPSLRRAIAILIAKVKSLKERNTSDKPSQSVHYQHQSPDVIDRAAKVIIKAVQREAFKEEFEVIAQSSSENDSSRNETKAGKKSPATSDYPQSPAKRRVLARRWSRSCSYPDRLMLQVQKAMTSYAGAKDGRLTSRQSRDWTAFYQRRVRCTWTLDSTDKKD